MPQFPLPRSDEPARHAFVWAAEGARKLFQIGVVRCFFLAFLGGAPFFGVAFFIAENPAALSPRAASLALIFGLLLSALLTPAIHCALCLGVLDARTQGMARWSSFAPAFWAPRFPKALAMGVVLIFFQFLGALPLILFFVDSGASYGPISERLLAVRAWTAPGAHVAALCVFSLSSWLLGSSLLWLAPTLLAEEPRAPLRSLLRASWISFWRNRSAGALFLALLATEVLALSFGFFFAEFFLDSIAPPQRFPFWPRLTPPGAASAQHAPLAFFVAASALFAFWRSILALSCSRAQRDLIVWLPVARLHPEQDAFAEANWIARAKRGAKSSRRRPFMSEYRASFSLSPSSAASAHPAAPDAAFFAPPNSAEAPKEAPQNPAKPQEPLPPGACAWPPPSRFSRARAAPLPFGPSGGSARAPAGAHRGRAMPALSPNQSERGDL